MYALIALLQAPTKQFWYQVTNMACTKKQFGIVEAPLQNRRTYGFIIQTQATRPLPDSVKIKNATLLEFADQEKWWQFLKTISHYYLTTPEILAGRMETLFEQMSQASFITKLDPEFTINKLNPIQSHNNKKLFVQKTLNAEQIEAYNTWQKIEKNTFSCTLLHGVTGSGKTEIYKILINEQFENGKSTLLLLPEVSMAEHFKNRLQKDALLSDHIYTHHSKTTPKERAKLFAAILAQQPILIIGVHLPILLPIANLGLIIVDEEHESGFQEKFAPYLNSKEIALWRAKLDNIAVILGSATPCATTWQRVKQNQIGLIQLKQRHFGSCNELVITDLISLEKRKRFWLTPTLEQALQTCLERREQAIIFLNRKGYDLSTVCSGCLAPLSCPNCAVSLKSYQVKDSDLQLVCHYCLWQTAKPEFCPDCQIVPQNAGKSKQPALKGKGAGTDKIIEMLNARFPEARILKADAQQSQKKSWQAELQAFGQGQFDILVGTKTVCKGYDFANVTLIGAIFVDTDLQPFNYNSSETGVQQLLQVAGRSGRESKAGKVVLQTMHFKQLLTDLNEQTYLSFLENELANRQKFQFPPFCKLMTLQIKAKSEQLAQKQAQAIYQKLQKNLIASHPTIKMYGPVEPAVNKIRNYYYKNLVIKAFDWRSVTQINTLLKNNSITNLSPQMTAILEI